MRPTIDEAAVRHIAKLSRLELSEDEVRQYSGQLTRILDYMRQLEALDTAGVEPLAHPLPLTNVLRDDEPRAGLDTETALSNSPQREGPFFRVPRVLDEGPGA